jgi:malic enzyme
MTAVQIGKLALYVAGAGIHPSRTLPVMFDVGTDNVKLRNDPLYMGLQQPRLKGCVFLLWLMRGNFRLGRLHRSSPRDEYYRLMGEFLEAVRERWPHVVVQFEDFSSDVAHPILHKYRHHQVCFNDDIQGTGAVALAGVLTALRAQGRNAKDLCEQRIVSVGSGSAGLGIISVLNDAMEREGMSTTEAAARFWMLDRGGLLVANGPDMTYGQRRFARSDESERMSLLDVVRKVKPTVLVGASGNPGLFTEEILRELASAVERPIVFPVRCIVIHLVAVRSCP